MAAFLTWALPAGAVLIMLGMFISLIANAGMHWSRRLDMVFTALYILLLIPLLSDLAYAAWLGLLVVTALIAGVAAWPSRGPALAGVAVAREGGVVRQPDAEVTAAGAEIGTQSGAEAGSEAGARPGGRAQVRAQARAAKLRTPQHFLVPTISGLLVLAMLCLYLLSGPM